MPNPEVKPSRADGTAIRFAGEQVVASFSLNPFVLRFKNIMSSYENCKQFLRRRRSKAVAVRIEL